ncbi:gamma-butyrobetaine hydroxylase-like domain-containing protein [Hydrogenophilus thiooxidans]|uniref:gamma-butyrobetaine hydroxylase-like domain-containing protein n=1 Tax=Hydrogenophilus thiooxidans TaxID=2820326 RepID=UPI001C2425CB|nr:DUF971 domain-containing protein [Hydrogenophilus thiooxidans]
MTLDPRHIPESVVYHQQRNQLEITFADGAMFTFEPEYLRVFSPSAEVQGHGPGQAVLQTGKKGVRIDRLTPSGHYALQIAFSDGHDSGLYTWVYLRELGETHAARWADYLAQLDAVGASREPPSHPLAEATSRSDACGCGQGGCGR